MERSGKQLSINNIGNILNITPSNAKRYIEYYYMEDGIELDFITDRYFGEQYLIENI
jgi:hypothetical protein